ncbi:MAG TPA: hypothetical protein VM600_03785 [Actinomycetota bacterium]|nr:hypothetical protein [Actinomycetota bacterium]
MIRRILAAAVIAAALASVTGASAGSIDVCTDTAGGPGSTGSVTVSEGGATVGWSGGSGGSGGAQQCLHIEHP